MDFLDVDNEEGDILLYQNVSRILTAIGWKEQDEETISESIEKKTGHGSIKEEIMESES